jgi:parallel beta-helix repeat protein
MRAALALYAFALLLCVSEDVTAETLVCENTTVSVSCDTSPISSTVPDSFRCTLTKKTPVPPPPPPPPPPDSTACTGTAIAASMSQATIQSKLTANTTTCWAPGLYNATARYVLPLGHKAICTTRRACTITGNNTSVIAFRVDHGSNNTRVQGFVMKDSATPGNWPMGCMQARDGGVIEDNEVSNCYVGMTVDENSTLLKNFIHHNRHAGINGGPGVGGLVDTNEISWNNTSKDSLDDAAGVKVIGSTTGRSGLVFRNNYVHDNYGQGLWSDGNVRVDYIGNRVENNAGVGIFHEISWDSTIKDNRLKNNSTIVAINQSCFHGGEIATNNSQRVLITGNIVTPAAGKNGICLNASDRPGLAAWFPQFLANVTVSNNQVFAHGLSKSGSSGNPSNGIVFSGNAYVLDNLTSQNWVMNSTFMTMQQWKAAGFDVNGTFATW